MKTQIVFHVDVNALPTGGTFANPATITYPPITVTHDGGSASSYSGNTTVRVPTGERMEIWLQDSHHRSSVIIAPVRFLADQWTPSGSSDPQFLTLETVNGPNSPIQRPNFSVTHEDEHSFVYADQPSDWETTSSEPFTTYFHGVDAPRDGSLQAPRVYHPYVTFNFNDYTGILHYGIEFTVAVNGESKGYWWFDPLIQVV